MDDSTEGYWGKDRIVFTEQGDPEIDSLHRRWRAGELNLEPEFQRGFVWDIKKASLLVESILLDIPLPVIYLTEEKNDIIYVIDGQQRLTTFFSFIDGKLPDPKLPYGRDFRLTGLKVYSECNGSLFRDLRPEYQKKIRYYKLRTITFRKQSHEDLKFEVFERLNTGSVSLNDQELRNCIYRGKYNEFLKELSENKLFKLLLGIKKPMRRMKDVELVLRFSAFFHAGYEKYKPTMKNFLNREMEKMRFVSNEAIEETRISFEKALRIIEKLLGKNAFKRFYSGDSKDPNGYWESQRFNASLYDISMTIFSQESEEFVYENLFAIKEAYLSLLTFDQEFIDSIELSTSSKQAIQKRFEKFKIELSMIKKYTAQGLMTESVKKNQYIKEDLCCICKKPIILLDDAIFKGGRRYWLPTGGGELSSLMHRFCNSGKTVSNPTRSRPITRTRTSTRRTIQIKGKNIECKNSVSVLVNTADWLIQHGYITKESCPIRQQPYSSNYLINTTPDHEDRSFISAKVLRNGLYIEGNWSTPNCIKWSEFLLERFNFSRSDFDLGD